MLDKQTAKEMHLPWESKLRHARKDFKRTRSAAWQSRLC